MTKISSIIQIIDFVVNFQNKKNFSHNTQSTLWVVVPVQQNCINLHKNRIKAHRVLVD